MHFYEFEAKQLLDKHRVPTPKRGLAKTAADAERIASELGGTVVVKSQVFARRRGAAGGVKTAATPAEARKAAEAILALEIGGYQAHGVLVEQKLEPVKTFCIKATYDAVKRRPVLIASDRGGQDMDDLQEQHPESVKRRLYSALTPLSEYRAKELAKSLGLGGRDLVRMTGIAAAVADICLRYDLTYAEINALGQLADGSFVALDCHLDLETEGLYRQQGVLKELGITDAESRGAREPTPFEVEAAKIDADDPRGIIGPVVEFGGDMGLVIGAGGGSITTFDAITRFGGNPANYAAIGGNPSVSKARLLTKLVLSKPGVDKICVISNVVSNTRADLVARGVIKGCLELGFEPKDKITIFRVPGAWEADAFKILDKYGIEYVDRSVSLSEAAKRAVEKVKH